MLYSDDIFEAARVTAASLAAFKSQFSKLHRLQSNASVEAEQRHLKISTSCENIEYLK
jgi:hypothetical protein